jgi:survival-of-motor-neuron-related-splicing factor 30
VNGPDVKPLTDTKKRALQASEEDAEREKKRKKNEKRLENKQAKAAEQVDKQKAWQSFAKKSAKKGVAIPGVEGKSMFRAPDNPYGKGKCISLCVILVLMPFFHFYPIERS